ncbi:NADH-dependent flavin oxidoreductase [Fusarium oxysporum f. sp. matthiolae]|jgi:2,4-dienoyl-CoA reductase-like NADH-dependent reductase (Old Yellow Enzyme family)|nr:NADH-dependent flavin oxidoreductase [Fusarium oxysporum f. sp. matthiolae]
MTRPRYGSEEVDPTPLGQPLEFPFSKRVAKNTFMKAAMTERLASWDPKDLSQRGIPTEDLINTYKWFGKGGIGMLLTGNLMVDPVNIEAAGNLIIPRDAPFEGPRFAAYQRLAHAGNHDGSLFLGQLSHAGRQVQTRFQTDPVSASAVHLDKDVWGMKFSKPHAASKEEIKGIVADFTHAAEFLYKSGFNGAQLHAAHGYLLSQFLSRRTNNRTDEYGGSVANRARIIVEIVSSIRSKMPTSSGFILGVKLNSVEFDEKGFTPEECGELCELLEKECQFDFVELSGGTYEDMAFEHKRDSTKKREAFFLDFAESIVPRLTKTKVYVTGGFRTVSAMVKALDVVDGIGLARPFCAEPSLVKEIFSGAVKTGTVIPDIDTQDYGLTEVVAGTQMRQLGRNQAPMDLSRPEVVEAFKKSFAKWEALLEEDGDKSEIYGYVDLEGVDLPLMSSDVCKL